VVTDLQVYTKNESSVSLRWKPPYPPTGVLEKYQIKYYNNWNSYLYGKELKMTSCKLWPDFHCATVANYLERGEGYTFEVGNLKLLEVVVLKLLLMYR
jgi:hypothetical protein